MRQNFYSLLSIREELMREGMNYGCFGVPFANHPLAMDVCSFLNQRVMKQIPVRPIYIKDDRLHDHHIVMNAARAVSEPSGIYLSLIHKKFHMPEKPNLMDVELHHLVSSKYAHRFMSALPADCSIETTMDNYARFADRVIDYKVALYIC